MKTTTHELAPEIFKIRTDIPGEQPFTFNQFLIRADQPLLYHTGPRKLFPAVSEAVFSLIDPADLKWIAFGHFEDDECGSLNEWQQTSENAKCVCLRLLAMTSLEGYSDKPVEVIGDDQARLDLGSHSIKLFATPHFTHAWESQLLFEETTGTLFSGDFGTQTGTPPIFSGTDTLEEIKAAELAFESTNVSPLTLKAIEKLSDMPIQTLAIMHGSSIKDSVGVALEELYAFYRSLLDQRLAEVAR